MNRITGEQLRQQRAESELVTMHKGLMHKFAKAGYGRLCKVGVEIEYEDVFQFMCMSMVKAYRKFDANNGNGFTAYMGRACMNNFNKWAEILIREQVELGLIRSRDMRNPSGTHHGGVMEEADALESVAFDDAPGPEELVIRTSVMKDRLARLSKDAKKVVVCLMRPPEGLRELFKRETEDAMAARADGRRVNARQDYTFGMIARHLGLPTQRMTKIKRELEERFEVQL